MKHEDLKTCLRSALAERSPLDLRQHLDRYGAVAVAAVLAAGSPRVAADVLSLLLPTQRTAVIGHLPRAMRIDDPGIRSLLGHGASPASTLYAHRTPSYSMAKTTITRAAP